VTTALDGLAPGLGGLIGATNQSVDALGNALTTIEGEYRVLMNHLAARAQQNHGYDCEYISIYSDDRKLPGEEVSVEKLATRVGRIVLSLNPKAADATPDDEADPDGTVGREASTQWRKFLVRIRDRFGVESIQTLRRTFGGKVLLIDESGADVLGGAPNDPYRIAVVRSLDVGARQAAALSPGAVGGEPVPRAPRTPARPRPTRPAPRTAGRPLPGPLEVPRSASCSRWSRP